METQIGRQRDRPKPAGDVVDARKVLVVIQSSVFAIYIAEKNWIS